MGSSKCTNPAHNPKNHVVDHAEKNCYSLEQLQLSPCDCCSTMAQWHQLFFVKSIFTNFSSHEMLHPRNGGGRVDGKF